MTKPLMLLIAVVALAPLAGCGGSGSSNKTVAGTTSDATSTQDNSGLTYRYPSCQKTDNDWDVTRTALAQATSDASYDNVSGADANALTNDLQQLASEANSANQMSTALIYTQAAVLFQGYAVELPIVGINQLPSDTAGAIPSARSQLQADCSLGSFQPSNAIQGAVSGGDSSGTSSTPSASSSAPTTTTTANGPGNLANQCDANISATSDVSCPFAENTFYEYAKATQSNANAQSTVHAWSPMSRRYFTENCSSGAGVVDCVNGNGADIRFSQSAITAYTPSQAAAYAASHDVGPNG